MTSNYRHKIVNSIIVLLFLIVTTRFFYWQIIMYPSYKNNILNQSIKPTIIDPSKGSVYDSHLFPLAINKLQYQLSIYKPDLKISTSDVLSLLSQPQITPLDKRDINLIQNFINTSSTKWVTLKTIYSKSDLVYINDPGLKVNIIQKRTYPEDKIGLQVINGIEKYYQKSLNGRNGFAWSSQDAVGEINLSKDNWSVEPKNGNDIHLSLDRRIQFIAQNQLENGIKDYNADSGSFIILEPTSGSILAMSSFEASPSSTKNISLTDLFEPGSIFKPLVMAAALNEKAITEQYLCTKCDRSHQIGEYSIGNWDNNFHSNSNIYDIIRNSDNVGMSYIIQNLGLDRFLKYFQLLGLTERTGIDLPNEAFPLPKKYWSDLDLATASFGQGFAITQIQMLTAFNTLANNGNLVKPSLSFSAPKKEIKNVYQPSTIDLMKDVLQKAVENGPVAKFKPPHLNVCAKSGTSQIAIKGGYSDSSTVASYIGFSPCQNPKFTMIITINNPRTSPWGSSTAAPIWYKIAEKIDLLL